VQGVAAAIEHHEGVAEGEVQRLARAFVWLRSFSLRPPTVVSFEAAVSFELWTLSFGFSHIFHLLRQISAYVGAE
jgi:hypothetical protein